MDAGQEVLLLECPESDCAVMTEGDGIVVMLSDGPGLTRGVVI